jgi:hypothetical protein
MTSTPPAISVGWPGRIGGYRNSAPRRVKLIGVGEGATAVVARVAHMGLPNVLVAPEVDGACSASLDAPVEGTRPNMIVLVYRSGDRVALPSLVEKPKLLVTLIVLEATRASPHAAEAEALRAMADLFITTVDGDFVVELVSNLAS